MHELNLGITRRIDNRLTSDLEVITEMLKSAVVYEINVLRNVVPNWPPFDENYISICDETGKIVVTTPRGDFSDDVVIAIDKRIRQYVTLYKTIIANMNT